MSNIVEFSTEQVNLIKKQICPEGTTDAELQLFVAQCKRTGLDPFNRQIYLQERRSQKNGNWISTKQVQVSIDGFRVIAQRSGSYAGQVGPFWCGDDGVWKEVWLESTPPKAAKVGVLRQDFKEPLWSVARFESYVQTTRDGHANSMWAKMPDLMLAKVAEALALRKAFPNDLGGLYSSEEMAQSDNVVEAKQVLPSQVLAAKPVEREIKNYATGEVKKIEASSPETMTPGQDVGEYVVQCGKKFKGMTLNKIGYDEVSSYLDYFIQSQQKEGKPFNPAVAEFVAKAEEFLNQGKTTATFGAPPMQENFDQIPF